MLVLECSGGMSMVIEVRGLVRLSATVTTINGDENRCNRPKNNDLGIIQHPGAC
jgi:hypothetical protein